MKKGIMVFFVVVLFFGLTPALFAGDITPTVTIEGPETAKPCDYGWECSWYIVNGVPIQVCWCRDGWLK